MWSQTSSAPIGAGQQEDGAVLGVGEHVVLLEEREVVAGHEVGLGAQVGAADQLGPKRRCETVMAPAFFES